MEEGSISDLRMEGTEQGRKEGKRGGFGNPFFTLHTTWVDRGKQISGH